MAGKVATGTGGGLIVLGLLIMFVVVPGMPTPPAYGANIGAGVLVLFSFVLLGAGLFVAATGSVTWIKNRQRRRNSVHGGAR